MFFRFLLICALNWLNGLLYLFSPLCWKAEDAMAFGRSVFFMYT